MTTNYGRRVVPTVGMGVGIAAVGGIGGLIWTVFAASITGAAPDVGPFAIARFAFPAFGVLFTLGAVGYGLYCVGKANAYNEAFAAYRRRRTAVKRPGDH